MNKSFTPSSTTLLSMVAAAEAKCDGDIEQAKLRKEAAGERFACRLMVAAAKQRNYARWAL